MNPTFSWKFFIADPFSVAARTSAHRFSVPTVGHDPEPQSLSGQNEPSNPFFEPFGEFRATPGTGCSIWLGSSGNNGLRLFSVGGIVQT